MIFIDTQIWIYAQKEPNEGRFENLNEYKKMLDLHQNADIFMQNCIKSHEIGMTYHQLSEIFHNLGFQGNQMDLTFCWDYCTKLLAARFMKWYPINEDHIKESLKLSRDSKIHIWDYLCILPMINDLDLIYTCG